MKTSSLNPGERRAGASRDSVCAEDGFARLKLKPHSVAASARQYLGAFEDNARLSHNRAATGRAH